MVLGMVCSWQEGCWASATTTSTEKVDEQDLEAEKANFLYRGAPDGMRCSIGLCLMTEAVMAMDGFSYQQASLEEYIRHCTADGKRLTSPLTNVPMGATYMPNHNLRTMVKDYIYEREKEWRDHLAQ